MTFALCYFAIGTLLWLFAASRGGPFSDAVEDGTLPKWAAVVSSLLFIAVWPVSILVALRGPEQ
jgi:hypothetical protein